MALGLVFTACRCGPGFCCGHGYVGSLAPLSVVARPQRSIWGRPSLQLPSAVLHDTSSQRVEHPHNKYFPRAHKAGALERTRSSRYVGVAEWAQSVGDISLSEKALLLRFAYRSVPRHQLLGKFLRRRLSLSFSFPLSLSLSLSLFILIYLFRLVLFLCAVCARLLRSRSLLLLVLRVVCVRVCMSNWPRVCAETYLSPSQH